MESEAHALSNHSVDDRRDLQPMNDFLEWAARNKEWIGIYVKYGTKQSVMDAILRADHNRFSTWKSVIRNFLIHSGIIFLAERY